MRNNSSIYRAAKSLANKTTPAMERLFGQYIDTYYPGWILERALRYIPVARCIEKGKNQSPKILEVGSGSSGITPYLKLAPSMLVGLDIDFSIDSGDIPNRTIASAIHLPFPSNSNFA